MRLFIDQIVYKVGHCDIPPYAHNHLIMVHGNNSIKVNQFGLLTATADHVKKKIIVPVILLLLKHM